MGLGFQHVFLMKQNPYIHWINDGEKLTWLMMVGSGDGELWKNKLLLTIFYGRSNARSIDQSIDQSFVSYPSLTQFGAPARSKWTSFISTQTEIALVINNPYSLAN